MYHVPIMVDEVIGVLLPERGGVFVDGTLGGGGHSEAILKRLPKGSRLIGIDRDGDAIAEATKRLEIYGEAFKAVRGNFFDMTEILLSEGVEKVDGILLDLGVSSFHLDTPGRGFSYHMTAALDMRMDDRQALTARDVVNGYSCDELTRVFRDYGEERYAKKIASAIIRQREKAPIETTTELAEIIKQATPINKRFEGKHPARRVFQAIRIEVNGELNGLRQAIIDAHALLKKGGVLAVITFHSLEDRVLKQCFKEFEKPCVCPPKSPVCTCGKKPSARLFARKPVEAGEKEREGNSRARSAKLRAIEKI